MYYKKPRVSIGLPVHNGERFLGETLDSLLAQSYADFELIISDNASTDGTQEICNLYAAKDQRVRYYRNAKNIGVGGNFNRVFELSNADYFKWASADDICRPEHLARCLDILEKDDTVVLAYPKTVFIDANGNTLDITDPGWDLRSEAAYERLRYVIHARHWVNPHYGLIRASALSKTRLMPTYPGGDFRLLAELSLKGRFVEIRDYSFLRRLHSGALSQNMTHPNWSMEFQMDGKCVSLPLWSLNVDFITTIGRSELSLRYKLSLLGSLVRSMYWDYMRLFQELRAGFMFYWDRLDPRTSRVRH